MQRVKVTTSVIDERGMLDVFDDLPFDCKRFFTIKAPKDQVRGNHAHHHTEMILYSVQGKIKIESMSHNHTEVEILIPGSFGLLLLPHEYRRMTFLEDACLLVLASTVYSHDDYIFEMPK